MAGVLILLQTLGVDFAFFFRSLLITIPVESGHGLWFSGVFGVFTRFGIIGIARLYQGILRAVWKLLVEREVMFLPGVILLYGAFASEVIVLQSGSHVGKDDREGLCCCPKL